MTRRRLVRSVLIVVGLAFAAGRCLAQDADTDAKELPAPELLTQWSDFSDWVNSVAFSPDGKLLAVGSYDVVRLY
ncbi:MAG: hypothetical protein ACREJB_18480, partial [Planctomycetaceae bacterium]